MIKINNNYFYDTNGKPVGVFVSIRQYRKLIKQVEELEAIKAYDEAKASKDEKIPFEEAVKEIEGKL